MSTTYYNRRTWLNDINCDSTGSVVAYDGLVTDIDTKQEYIQRYLEISDCHRKIRLHKTSDDRDADFLNKMLKLRDELDSFIDHLKNKKRKKQ